MTRYKDPEYLAKYRQKNSEIIKIKQREYREKNRSALSQKRKEYREKNKESLAIYAKGYFSNLRKTNPDKAKSYHLKFDYGINVNEYNRILDEQNGVCGICGKIESEMHRVTKKVKLLSVDHEHASGKVRGLLCSKCNRGIGAFLDSEDLLMKAIKYLRRLKS